MEPGQLFALLLAVPVLAAALAAWVPSNRWRPWLVPAAGAAHLGLVVTLLTRYGAESSVQAFNGWLVVDPLSRVFLAYLSVFFLIVTSYAPAYLGLRQERNNRWLCSCLPLSLAVMTLVTLSHHLGLMWVALEGTTLITAPSIYFNHNPRSLEATWKYLLIGSVGIALALLGTFFLAYSALYAGGQSTLRFEELLADARAGRLSSEWFHAAFVFLFVGYGTKMGLAPMHTWKPDAYGEAPGMIGALMAGGMTSCAFLAILRVYQIAVVAHDAAFVQRTLIVFGLFSMVVAAVYMSRQRDIKRLLAYSSVEHMGMLICGVGLGTTAGGLGSLMHVLHNGFTKGVLFLAAANIHRAYGSRSANEVQGVLRRLPVSGAMLFAGFLAITGAPPFAPFISEFQIVSTAFVTGHYVAGAVFLACMLFVFFGMGYAVVSMCFGNPPGTVDEERAALQDRAGTALPMLVSFALVLLLGVYNPPVLRSMLQAAAEALYAQ